MKAKYRVLYSDGTTAGFILENNVYTGYNEVLKHIDSISNIYSTKDGVIKAKGKKLQEKNIKQVNEVEYRKIVKRCPIKRDIQRTFREWSHLSDDRILFVKGTKGIGKTTEILKFAYKNFEQVIYVNLKEKNDLNNFIEMVINDSNKYLGMYDFCIEHKGYLEYFDCKDTVLIIDEIQESSEVFNSLRSLRNDLKCRIIVAGSYLAQALNPEYFQPAGDTYDVEMSPLSFREFCRVFGVEKTLDNISVSGESEEKSYIDLTDMYKIYSRIGEYPAVVKEYVISKDFGKCDKIIADLINRFTNESAHYFKDDKCRKIFESVYKAAVIAQVREKKGTDSKIVEVATNFVKNDTKESVARSEVNKAMTWLLYNGVLGNCDLYNNGNPLELLYDRRIYFRDCGILNFVTSTTGIDEDTKRGLIAETFAYNELYRVYNKIPKVVKGDKPCCSVKDNHELDFMIIDTKDKKYGVEIKSKRNNNPVSLSYYLNNKLVDIGVIAEITRGGKGEKWLTIPIYAIGEKFPYDI